MFTYRWRSCFVMVDDENRFLATFFADGSHVPATANDDDDSTARAHALGYRGDTWAMSRDHEIAHTWLAIRQGLAYSPVLWKVAHGDSPLSDAEVAEEEARVLAFQARLDKSLPRPWDPR